MKLRTLFSFSFSLVIHVLFLLLLFLAKLGGSGDSLDKKNSQGQGPERFKGVDVSTVIEKDKPVEVDLVYRPEPELKGEVPILLKKIPKVTPQECPGLWYGGLGIQVDLSQLGEVIDVVYRGYGADIAGLQVGDVIEWASEPEIIGEPGTLLSLRIRRGTEILNIDAVRTKVCY